MARVRLVALALAIAVLTGCIFERKLDLTVVNDLGDSVEVLYEWGNRQDQRSLLTVDAGDETRVVYERPPEWLIKVNDRLAIKSDEWPSDNPVIDLTVHVNADGSVTVSDS